MADWEQQRRDEHEEILPDGRRRAVVTYLFMDKAPPHNFAQFTLPIEDDREDKLTEQLRLAEQRGGQAPKVITT